MWALGLAKKTRDSTSGHSASLCPTNSFRHTLFCSWVVPVSRLDQPGPESVGGVIHTGAITPPATSRASVGAAGEVVGGISGRSAGAGSAANRGSPGWWGSANAGFPGITEGTATSIRTPSRPISSSFMFLLQRVWCAGSGS